MQFFLGLQTYRPKPLFSPTLFVELRKKLGEDTLGEFSETLITLSEGSEAAAGGPDAPKRARPGRDLPAADRPLPGANSVR